MHLCLSVPFCKDLIFLYLILTKHQCVSEQCEQSCHIKYFIWPQMSDLRVGAILWSFIESLSESGQQVKWPRLGRTLLGIIALYIDTGPSLFQSDHMTWILASDLLKNDYMTLLLTSDRSKVLVQSYHVTWKLASHWLRHHITWDYLYLLTGQLPLTFISNFFLWP